MTDVDKKYREPPTTRMIKEQEMLREMFKNMNLEIDNSSDEYLEAQVQLLYRGLKDIAPSSSIGKTLSSCSARWWTTQRACIKSAQIISFQNPFLALRAPYLLVTILLATSLQLLSCAHLERSDL